VSRTELEWYRLRWPRETETERLRALALLLAASARPPVVVEAVGQAGRVEHRFGLPAGRGGALVEQLRSVVSGLGLVPVEARSSVAGQRAVELRLTTAQRPLRAEQAELVSRAVLSALARARREEQLILQWELLAVLPPSRVGSGPEQADPLPASVADVLLGRRGRLDSEARQALRAKRMLPVWRAVGRIAVRASAPARAQSLLREVVAALRLAEAPGVRFHVRRCRPGGVDRPGRSWLASLRLNTDEFVALSGWPVGVTARLPVACSGGRRLPVGKAVASRGRVVGVGTAPGAERPVALSVEDSLRHLHVLGPTGVGKSTLLLNLIVQDIAAGRGLVVIEPKGDLVDAVLERVPAGRRDDVVLLDPSDEEAPVGLNPLAVNGRPAELVADELLDMFRSLYESSWGPRTNDILGASLLSLARTPGMTLCALPALLTDAGFRHRLVAGLDDPIALEPFWAGFEGWSEAERMAAIAPSLNRIRPFLLRPQLRAVLGQARPRFDLGQVFEERKVLLVSLAKGLIGAEAATLLGGLVVSQLWAAASRRAGVAATRRTPVFVYIDEFQDYLRLPTDLGDALAQARGLGVGFTLAHQHLSQLPPALRSALLANARSRACFQLAGEDARALASEPLVAEDFRELPAFEIYAQLVAGGSAQPWCSARTLPASAPPVRDGSELRQRSRQRYGQARGEVDAEIEQLLGRAQTAIDDLSPRRRSHGGQR
jgi:hypothetical protein